MRPPPTEAGARRSVDRLRELGLKLTDYQADRLVKLAQGLYQLAPIGWRSLIEGYLDHEMCLHEHRGMHAYGGFGDSDTAETCTVYEWPVELTDDLKLVVWEAIRYLSTPELGEGGRDAVQAGDPLAEMRMAMLVDVPKFLKYRERVPLGRLLPYRKRLQSLDLCAETWPDSPEAMGIATRPIAVVNLDGEADLSPRAVAGDWVGRGPDSQPTLLLNSQFPHEVVECRSEVVDRIPEDCADDDRGRLFPDLPDDIEFEVVVKGLGCWHAYIGWGLTPEEGVRNLYELPNMYVRPIEASDAAVQWVRHDC